MADEIEYREIGGAEMHPDLYDGTRCDQVKPLWNGWMEGDKQGEDGVEVIDYPAHAYPLGTKISISVPCCPKCQEPAEAGIIVPDTPVYIHDCECGFSWKDWAEGKYS